MGFGRLIILAIVCCLLVQEHLPAALSLFNGSSASSRHSRFPSKKPDNPAPLEKEEVAEREIDGADENPWLWALPREECKALTSPAFPDSGPYRISAGIDLLYSLHHLLI